MKSEKQDWRHRLKVLVTGMIALVIAAAWISESWVIPSYLRSQIMENLPDYWQGQAEIDEIEFSFFRPVVLRGVNLVDQKKQRWLYAESITFKLDGWPGTHPVLSEIDVVRPDLQVYFVNGQCQPPIRNGGGSSSEPNPYVNLRHIYIDNIRLATVNSHGLKKVWNGLQFSADREGPVYSVRLSRLSDDDSSNLLFGGTVDPDTLEVKLSMQLSCQAERQDMAPILAMEDVSFLREADGRLMACLAVNGKLNDLSNLKCRGTINLDNWNISLFHNLELSNLNVLATVDGRRIDFQNLSAESCDGTIQGTMWLQMSRNKNVQYGGKLMAEHINLHQLTEGINELPRINQGTATAQYTFDMSGDELSNLRAYGLLMLDDALLWNMPVVLQLLTQFKINNNDPMSLSDVVALFAMNGANTTFHRAVLTSAISAVEMEPGGRVNLQTGQVDLYVIGIPLKMLRKFISAIPLVKLIVPLRDRLSRFHLQGNWSEPASALIFKAPAKRLATNTESFMKTTARTGGQVTEDTFNAFKRMFEDLSRKKSSQTTKP